MGCKDGWFVYFFHLAENLPIENSRWIGLLINIKTCYKRKGPKVVCFIDLCHHHGNHAWVHIHMLITIFFETGMKTGLWTTHRNDIAQHHCVSQRTTSKVVFSYNSNWCTTGYDELYYNSFWGIDKWCSWSCHYYIIHLLCGIPELYIIALSICCIKVTAHSIKYFNCWKDQATCSSSYLISNICYPHFQL